MGIPIPHTAIIPERKEQFGETLGEFVQDSFLTPESIVERVRAANVSGRLADWLAEPANASRLARHVMDGALAVADLLRDDDVHTAIETVVRERLDAVELAPVAGRALRMMTADQRHHEVVDAALRGLDKYIDENRDDLRVRFGGSSPWWLPGAVEDRIFERLLDGARALLQDIAADRDHHLRSELDERLARLASDLETSPALRARGEQLKHDLLNQPQLREWVASLWADVKAQLRDQAADPDSQLRRRLTEAIITAGTRLRDDVALRGKLQDGVESGARYVAEQFHGEIAALVSSTIERWDAAETSRRLELLLGRDLQFIRINGTVVGGLAGLCLHGFTHAVG
jgi:uncharacterized membrane-anchored protein YjiN (DUF445 family)